MIRFLVDENLSPALLAVAHTAGYEAMHVNHLGLRTAKDWTLMHFVVDGDWILVTNNAIEFRARYRDTALHPGVVFLVPSVPRAGQVALFRTALDHISEVGSLVNEAIDVDFAVDRSIVLRRYSLP